MGTRSERAFWVRALSTYVNRWTTSRAVVDEAVLRNLVYALGRSREKSLLERLRLDTRFPSSARTAAAWWYAIPDRVHESAAS